MIIRISTIIPWLLVGLVIIFILRMEYDMRTHIPSSNFISSSQRVPQHTLTIGNPPSVHDGYISRFSELPEHDIPNNIASNSCVYPIVTLISGDYCLPAYVLFQSLVRISHLEHYSTCFMILYVDHSLPHTNNINLTAWKNVNNPFTNDPYCARIDKDAQLHDYSVTWWSVPNVVWPDWFDMGGTAWAYSMHKIHSFGMPMPLRSDGKPATRFLFIDGDAIAVRHINRIFADARMDVDIAGVADLSNHCNARRGMNGGILLIRPSHYLHSTIIQCLHEHSCSCLSNTWHWSDQELLQCLCGMITVDIVPKHAIPVRPDLQCQMLPVYTSIYPPVYTYCQDVQAQPIRIMHFMAGAKPWRGESKTNADGTTTRPWQTDRYSVFWTCVHDATWNINDREQQLKQLSACDINI